MLTDASKPSDMLDCYDILHWLGETVNPRTYLEIGVREGASLCSLLIKEREILDFVRKTIVEGKVQLSDDITARIREAYTTREVNGIYLFDNWSYDGGKGGHERIAKLLEKGFNKTNWNLYDGDSKETLPKFFEEHRDKIDVIFVDGDHTAEGAIEDLENVAGRFKVLVFDDIYHPQHGYLADIWKTYTRKHDLPNFMVGRGMLGVGVAFNFG